MQPKFLNDFGDIEKCENQGYQYVLASVHGEPKDNSSLVMLGEGKYFQRGSVIGLCLPFSCHSEYI